MDKWSSLKVTGAEFIRYSRKPQTTHYKIIVDLFQPLVEASSKQTGNDVDTDRERSLKFRTPASKAFNL